MSAFARTYWKCDDLTYGSESPRTQVPRNEANLVGSRLHDGRHAPAIDVDHPCALVPSSTEGHYHLLIDKPMAWWRYRVLLRAMVFAGIVEKRYYQHSIKRKQTFLRLPHIKKEKRG